MSVYTVHEPPLRAVEALADPQRFVFVRDGFYVWAFLLTPLWMIRHRLWLILALYVVVTIAIEGTLRAFGVSGGGIALVGILISFLVGLEAASLRRFTLRRRRWRHVGVVSGDRLEDAELRFFDAWVRQGGAHKAAPSSTKPNATPSAPPSPDTTGVIGLFPEPGAPR